MFAKARNLVCTILGPPSKRPVFHPRLTIVIGGNRFASNVPDASSIKVLHDPIGQEFHIEFDNCRAFLSYEMKGDLIQIMHTEVPKEVGGKGFGKVLAQAALEHIEKHKYRTEVHCDYFRHYVETKKPEYLKYFED